MVYSFSMFRALVKGHFWLKVISIHLFKKIFQNIVWKFQFRRACDSEQIITHSQFQIKSTDITLQFQDFTVSIFHVVINIWLMWIMWLDSFESCDSTHLNHVTRLIWIMWLDSLNHVTRLIWIMWLNSFESCDSTHLNHVNQNNWPLSNSTTDTWLPQTLGHHTPGYLCNSLSGSRTQAVHKVVPQLKHWPFSSQTVVWRLPHATPMMATPCLHWVVVPSGDSNVSPCHHNQV